MGDQFSQWCLPRGTLGGRQRTRLGFFTFILPYIEQDPLDSQIDFSKPIADEANQAVRETIVPAYVSPAVEGPRLVKFISSGDHTQGLEGCAGVRLGLRFSGQVSVRFAGIAFVTPLTPSASL